MKRILLYLLLLLPLGCFAETAEQRAAHPHQLRFGIGDSFLDQLFYNDNVNDRTPQDMKEAIKGMSAQDADAYLRQNRMTERSRVFTTGNIFVEYQYRLNSWFGIGVDVNVLPMWRKYSVMNGYHEGAGTYTAGYCFISALPRAEFTWLSREHVNLYSGVGWGVTMKCAMEPVVLTSSIHEWPKTPVYSSQWGTSIDMTLLGVSFGGEKIFGSVEFSPMFHLGFNDVDWWSAGSRFLKLSLGWRM